MSNARPVTDAEFDTVVLKSDKPVFVDFWADWCGPCKQLSPIVDELAGVYGDRMHFVKVDTNDNPRTPASYGVQSLPTLLIFNGGEVVKTVTGRSKAQIMRAIEEFVD